MRPGQLTPENACVRHGIRRNRNRFNEAGAINPGKQESSRASFRKACCFNEAGAINPGKLLRAIPSGCGFRRFNEAGAINPGKHRQEWMTAGELIASMRPGQLTPENASLSGTAVGAFSRLQ